MKKPQPRIEAISKKLRITVPSTGRIEAFSDGIFAFIATLLVIELNPPVLSHVDSMAIWQSLLAMWPKFYCFAFSFFTIVIVWVNHHHFFHQFHKSDAKLLWLNNFLLFFLAMVPFTTAFLGDYPWEPAVGFLYSIIMFLAIFCFYLMVRHAFLNSDLLEQDFPLSKRRKEVKRAASAVILYAIAAGLSFIAQPLTLAMLVLIPLIYFIPSIIEDHELAK